MATDRETLRRLLLGLFESALDAVAGRGELELDLYEGSRTSDVDPPEVLLVLRSSGVMDESDEPIRTSASPIIGSLGGTMVLDERSEGGTVIAVRLPCAC